MKAILIVMLAVQLLMLVAVATTILKRRTSPNGARRPPVWSSLAISLVITSAVSFQIADRHAHDPASELLQYGSGVLMGMALVSLLLLLRERMDRR
jgi:hypothetical protein